MLSNLRARIPFTPRNALALGLHLGLGSLPLLLAPVAAARQQVQRYDIPAGQLGDVLSSFARQAGVAISFDASQVAGRRSTGLQGSYGVNEGFAVLLGGQGLQAQGSADGFVLVSVPGNDGALELGATTINSQLLGSTTEGTGSYTTGITNAATKLNLSLRETPQSISVMTRQRMEDQNLRSIGQVLEQTPGVNVQSPGSDRLYVFSRGLAIDSYQYDGMPTTTFAFSQALPQAASDMATDGSGRGFQYRMPRSYNGASRDSSNHQESVNTFTSLEQRLGEGWSLKLAANYLYGTRDYDSVIVGTTRTTPCSITTLPACSPMTPMIRSRPRGR